MAKILAWQGIGAMKVRQLGIAWQNGMSDLPCPRGWHAGSNTVPPAVNGLLAVSAVIGSRVRIGRDIQFSNLA